MHKCTRDLNQECDYCRQTEDNIHLFIQFPKIKNIWGYYQSTLSVNKLNKHTAKLTLTVIQIIIYEIWE